MTGDGVVTTTWSGTPGVWVNVAWPLNDPEAAVIVYAPAFCDAVSGTVNVPSPLSVTVPMAGPPAGEEARLALSPGTRWPLMSVIDTTAVRVVTPSAGTVGLERSTRAMAAGPRERRSST